MTVTLHDASMMGLGAVLTLLLAFVVAVALLRSSPHQGSGDRPGD